MVTDDIFRVWDFAPDRISRTREGRDDGERDEDEEETEQCFYFSSLESKSIK